MGPEKENPSGVGALGGREGPPPARQGILSFSFSRPRVWGLVGLWPGTDLSRSEGCWN